MKYYFLLFFVFCILIGGGIFVLNPDPIAISLFQATVSFPLSVWILLGVGLFFLISLLIFANSWAKKLLLHRKTEKDLNLLIEQIYRQTLHQDWQSLSFKTPSYQVLSQILARFNLSPNLHSSQSTNPKIDQLFCDLQELEKGVFLKRTFEKHTDFWTKNLLNRIDSDLKFAHKILDEDFPCEIKEYAIQSLINRNAFNEKVMQKIPTLPSQDLYPILNAILERGYKLKQEDFISLLLKTKESHYFELMQKFKQCFDPEFCIALFHELSRQKSEARSLYVYILMDYSMFDKAKEFLEDHRDLILPKAYLELKDQGKNYPLELFFTPFRA